MLLECFGFRSHSTMRITVAVMLLSVANHLLAADGEGDKHVEAARTAAHPLWSNRVDGLCGPNGPERGDLTASVKAPVTSPEVPNWPEPPARIFDNLYFVGSKGVSAFAIVTSDGIIITDAMWAYDVEQSVAGGLRLLGLDPAAIRYVIVPHGHPDHYGGAQFLHDKFGAKIVAPRRELDTIKSFATRGPTPTPRAYDRLVGDGDTLTLGETTVSFHEMPGHTPGGVVMTFPVSDRGKSHHMLIWSAGAGTPGSSARRQTQMPALKRLVETVKARRVDALAENHDSHLLLESMKASPSAGNPFLVGEAAVMGYLTMRLECDQAREAETGRSDR
jgi:metallo-beta-lactamase class B